MIKIDDIKIGDILYSKSYETYDIVSCVLIKNQTIYISVITPTSRNFFASIAYTYSFSIIKNSVCEYTKISNGIFQCN